ncbi:unnamed protein product [Clonostachys chloroleuca]|uniref:Uncharacterized protein n=1 Tax=Clonostachys chloroleuca TaxID=1926264 RepID=A0AA35MHI6_9HYPO|nr:unnamed protein product [Clonostachys chloroleuca]
MSSSSGRSGEYNELTCKGYVDPDFPNPRGKWDTPVIIYGYTPKLSIALFAAIWFLLLFIVHLAQCIRHRSWWFITFPVGLVFEIVGYVARSLSAKVSPYNLIYFILQYFFIVTAPVFLAAGIYTILSALISRLGRQYSFLPPKFILWFFITSDVIATLTQITGAALIGVSQTKRKDPATANNILLGGLAYQVFSMGVFVFMTATFLFRARRAISSVGLTAFSLVFAIAAVLIYLRTCFRLAETAEGLGGALLRNETFFACLEFAPVALAVLLYAIWHPGRCLGSRVRAENEAKIKERTVPLAF